MVDQRITAPYSCLFGLQYFEARYYDARISLTLLYEMGHTALYNEFGGSDHRDIQFLFREEAQMIKHHLE